MNEYVCCFLSESPSLTVLQSVIVLRGHGDYYE